MEAKHRAQREAEATTSEAGTRLTTQVMAVVIMVRLKILILIDHESS